jgi:two-component system, NtrC family, response regulator AtoC
MTINPLSLSQPPRSSSEAAELVALCATSHKMRDIWDMIVQVAPTTATALILGESGVGKDMFARVIHAMSKRADGPFVKVNCAALPATLLESELFGHEKGAFTGAFRQKLGQFEYAKRGTICLDEIGEMPRELQAKLLHVVQDLQFSRVGGRELISADVRIIATTNRNLETAMSRGEFREDLYYRLNVVEIVIPPLRERPEAIPLLVDSFLRRFNLEYGRQVRLSPETGRLLTEYSWPGNVRELENSIRRLVVIGSDGYLRDTLIRDGASRRPAAPVPPRPALDPTENTRHQNEALPNGNNQNGTHHPLGLQAQIGLKDIARRAARDAERAALLEVLERVRWNRTEAARVLKVSYKTMLSKLAECGIPPARTKGDPS